MKNVHFLISLLAAVLVSCQCFQNVGTLEGIGPNCPSADFSPEQYRFYGTKDVVIQKLGKISSNLSERRMFLQLTQGEFSAEVRLYQRQQDGNFTVTTWTPKETSQLVGKIEAAIMANKGVNCAGEQIKSVLAEELKQGHVQTSVAAPVSARAAFAHSIKHAIGKFISEIVILGC